MADPLKIRVKEKDRPTSSVEASVDEIQDAIRADLSALRTSTRAYKIQKIQELLGQFFVSKEERKEPDSMYTMYIEIGSVTYHINKPFNAEDFNDADPEVDVKQFMTDMVDYALEIADLDKNTITLEMVHPFQEGIHDLKNEVYNTDLFKQHEETITLIRSHAGSWNLPTLQSDLGNLETIYTDLVDNYGLIMKTGGGFDTTRTDLDIREKNAVLRLAQKYDLLKRELELRIQLEGKWQQYKKLQNDVEIEKAKKRPKKRALRKLADLMLVLGHEIDALVRELMKFPDIDPATINTNAIPRIRPQTSQIQQNGFQTISVPINGMAHQVTSVSQLNQLYTGIITPVRLQQIVTMIGGMSRGAPLTGLTLAEWEYATAYQQLAFDHMLGIKHDSEAEFLRELVKIDSTFSNDEFGKVSDFRKLAKRIKKASKKENKKAKYLKKAFRHLVAYTRARAFNAQGLEMYDAMLSNRSGLTHNHQASITATDIWYGAPYYLASVAKEWFGTGWQGIIGNVTLPRYAVNRKEFSTFMPPSLVFGMEDKKGTHMDQYGEIPHNAVLSRNPKGGREVLGELSNDSLSGLYLMQYNIKVIDPPEMADKKFTSPQLAYNLLKRWFRGGEYAFDVVSNFEARGVPHEKALEMAEQIILDAMVYDDDLILQMREEYHNQAAYYRSAKEKKGKQKIVTRNIADIPVSERHRMFSRAAMIGLAKGLGLGHMDHSIIQDRLKKVYGGGARDAPGKFVDNSSEVVGRNMARLVDSLEGVGYAISPRSWDDFGTLDNMLDQVQTHGIFETGGNMITTALQQLPWMKPEYAQRIGSIAATVGKVGAAIFVIKELWGWMSKGKGFRGKTGRLGSIVVGAMLFGKDLVALGYGGKGGMLADAMSHYLDKGKDFENRRITSQEMLGFTFGHVTMKELHEQTVFNKNSGQFEFKPDVMAQLTALGLEQEQKELLGSLMNDSRSGLNLMLHEGLTDSGITSGSKFDAVARKYGNMKLKDWINVIVNVEVIRKALGPTVDQVTIKAIEAQYMNATETEKRQMKTRILDIQKFGMQFNHTKLYLHDHLLKYRTPLLAANGINTADLTAGYANTTGLVALQKDYILGTISDVQMNAGIDALFGAAATPFGTAMHALKFKDIQDAIDMTATMNKDKMVVDVTDQTAHTAGGLVLGYGTAPQELMINFGPSKPATYFVGVEDTGTSAPGTLRGDTNKYLTFWIEDGKGTWEEWKIEKIGNDDAFIEGFAYHTFTTGGTTTTKFALRQWDKTATTITGGVTTPDPRYRWNDDFGLSLLENVINTAEEGKNSYTINGADITDPGASSMSGQAVSFKKTGNTRG